MSGEELIIASKYLVIYAGFFATIVGSIGNILNIVIFLGTKKYRNLPSSIFLAGASIGEELAIISIILPQSIATATGFEIRAVSSVLCKLSSILYTGGGVLALSSLYISAFDRYLQTSRSAAKRQWMNVKRARIIMLVAALFSAGASTPFAIFRDVIPNANTCDNINVVFAHFGFYFYAFIALFSPTLLLGALVFLTWHNLKQTRERQAGNQNAQNLTQHVTRMIMIQTTSIIISILPATAVSIYALVYQKNSLLDTPQDIFALSFTQILVYTNSCTSFYFYLITSAPFRQQAKSIILCGLCRRNHAADHTQHTKTTNAMSTHERSGN